MRMTASLALALALGACGGEELTIVALHGVEAAAGETCLPAEGAAPDERWDATQRAGYFVAVELRNETGDPLQVASLSVAPDTAPPWSFLPEEVVVPVGVILAPSGEEGDTRLVVLPLLDARLGQLASQGGEGADQSSAIDLRGEEWPLRVGVTALGPEEETSAAIEHEVILCNRCFDPDPSTPEQEEPCPSGSTRRGCSTAHEGGFACG